MSSTVRFARGTSARFDQLVKDQNTLYFITDKNEIFLGDERFSFGKDITIQTEGDGDILTNVSWDSEERTLTFASGEAGDIQSIVDAIAEATSSIVESISSESSSAIVVDDTDPKNIQLSLKLASGQAAGNVTLTQTAAGLKADIDLPNITMTVSSSSTDEEIATAKAVWTAIKESGGGIDPDELRQMISDIVDEKLEGKLTWNVIGQ